MNLNIYKRTRCKLDLYLILIDMGYKLTWIYVRPNGTEQKIRPVWWQPWANTLLYLPLNSVDTYTDQSWFNRSLTNTNVTFWTYKWVDCGYFDWYAHIQCDTMFEQTQSMTVLCRCYSTWSTYDANRMGQIYDACDGISRNVVAYSIEWQHWYVAYADWEATSGLNYTNQWILVVGRFTTSDMSCYVKNSTHDESKTANVARPAFLPSYINIWNEWNNAYNRYFIWWLSNLIVEDKIWTSGQIADYYETTKGNYWIS